MIKIAYWYCHRVLTGVLAVCLLLQGAAFAVALADQHAVSQGELPTYSQLPSWARASFSATAYEEWIRRTEMQMSVATYTSDGLKVRAIVCAPLDRSRKYPVLLWNHGGTGPLSAISKANFEALYEIRALADEGFVVLASQYRGIGGSEGRDEVGGNDVHDLKNLVDAVQEMSFVDESTIFAVGVSRGALMALQAARDGMKIRAAVAVGLPIDWESLLARPGAGLNQVRDLYATPELRVKFLERRSPAQWIDEIDVPLLLVNGGADTATPPSALLELAKRLEEKGSLYELRIYAGDNHFVTANRQDRMRRTVEWLKNTPKMPATHLIESLWRKLGIDGAIGEYQKAKEMRSPKYDFNEADLNNLGYDLLSNRFFPQAIAVFTYATKEYPASFNAFDSLGEAHAVAGNRELAIENYRKSLSLNSANENARSAIRRLEAHQ